MADLNVRDFVQVFFGKKNKDKTNVSLTIYPKERGIKNMVKKTVAVTMSALYMASMFTGCGGTQVSEPESEAKTPFKNILNDGEQTIILQNNVNPLTEGVNSLKNSWNNEKDAITKEETLEALNNAKTLLTATYNEVLDYYNQSDVTDMTKRDEFLDVLNQYMSICDDIIDYINENKKDDISFKEVLDKAEGLKKDIENWQEDVTTIGQAEVQVANFVFPKQINEGDVLNIKIEGNTEITWSDVKAVSSDTNILAPTGKNTFKALKDGKATISILKVSDNTVLYEQEVGVSKVETVIDNTTITTPKENEKVVTTTGNKGSVTTTSKASETTKTTTTTPKKNNNSNSNSTSSTNNKNSNNSPNTPTVTTTPNQTNNNNKTTTTPKTTKATTTTPKVTTTTPKVTTTPQTTKVTTTTTKATTKITTTTTSPTITTVTTTTTPILETEPPVSYPWDGLTISDFPNYITMDYGGGNGMTVKKAWQVQQALNRIFDEGLYDAVYNNLDWYMIDTMCEWYGMDRQMIIDLSITQVLMDSLTIDTTYFEDGDFTPGEDNAYGGLACNTFGYVPDCGEIATASIAILGHIQACTGRYYKMAMVADYTKVHGFYLIATGIYDENGEELWSAGGQPKPMSSYLEEYPNAQIYYYN